jgi:hypothetical protein
MGWYPEFVDLTHLALDNLKSCSAQRLQKYINLTSCYLDQSIFDSFKGPLVSWKKADWFELENFLASRDSVDVIACIHTPFQPNFKPNPYPCCLRCFLWLPKRWMNQVYWRLTEVLKLSSWIFWHQRDSGYFSSRSRAVLQGQQEHWVLCKADRY